MGDDSGGHHGGGNHHRSNGTVHRSGDSDGNAERGEDLELPENFRLRALKSRWSSTVTSACGPVQKREPFDVCHPTSCLAAATEAIADTRGMNMGRDLI